MKELLKWIEMDLKHIVNDLIDHGKSISVGEMQDDEKEVKGQYYIKAKLGLDDED
ncbi:hypothetical protein [Alkalihalobacterium chitinilyticum]|uniref:Uncharacterized protein n=1 Tax=Alkalihalobacterium chitinilyticum TaxID=2980103 RepID=A0ABT5VET0_9BACI|nr:hypothetical protein [Alkalihalobacterium chitinilyticum]MDE5413656.1 hypothetical protein [Alkalihalobacterium chitinilyticum]